MSENTVRIKPYDGTSDFAIWQLKLRAILIREKCWNTVQGKFPVDTSPERKVELEEQAHSEIFIRLSDDVARQVVSFTDPSLLWKKLEDLYLRKSLPSRISLLCKLFNFRMDVHMSLQDNLDIFLKLTQDLERCNDKISDDHAAILLLNSLPNQFDNFKDVIQYSQDEISKEKKFLNSLYRKMKA